MGRKVLLALAILICSLAGHGQNITTLTGIVTDKDGIGLPGVSVKAYSFSSPKTTITETNGLYKLPLPMSDSIVVCVSYLGFKTLHFVIRGRKEYVQKNIVLEEDTMALQEVVVQANNVMYKSEKSIFFPTKSQRQGTNSGIGLLYYMMIPELRVNKRSGVVVTSDNKNVTQCINGVQASLTEIKAIRPKDIIRIDYHPVPTGKFAKYDAVIDYIVKHQNYGGYVDIKTSTSILNTMGDYDVITKYNHNDWAYTLMSGLDFTNISKNRNYTDEWVGLSPCFEKLSLTNKYRQSTVNQYAHLVATKTTENIQASFKTGVIGNSVPRSKSESTVSYDPEVYPNLNATVRKYSRNIGTYLDGCLHWTLNKSQDLTLTASYQYGHSKYNRRLTENEYNSVITTKENSHNYTVGIDYSLNTSKSGSLTLQLYESGDIYKDKYTGDIIDNQKLVNNYLKASLLYRYNFSERLFIQTNLTLQHVMSIVTDAKENKWIFLPNLYLSCKTGERGRVVVNAVTGFVTPPIDWKSDTYQNVNTYEQIKGNKGLCHFLAYMPSVSYIYSLKNVNMNFAVNSFLSKHSVQDSYLVENNKLIHTYQLGKSFCYISFDYKITTFLLNRNLQLSGGIGYNKTKTNDEQRKKWGGFRYSLDFMYSSGDFTFSGSYVSRIKGIEFTGSSYSEIPHCYNLSASYSKGRWYASMEFDNIFGGRNDGKEYVNSLVYRRVNSIKSWEYSPLITFKLSYNIDLGHKKIKHVDEQFDKSISTGFLRPKE